MGTEPAVIDEIRRELVAMATEDRRVRAELAAAGTLYDGYHPRMEEVHRRNAARLAEIVGAVGWPGRSLVGEEASAAAWLVLQHAIGDPPLQRRGLVWLREAASRGDVPLVEVAMLEDRVRVFEGKPQRYGAQLDTDEQGSLVPFPTEGETGVDERRAGVGLPPLTEALRRKQELLAGEGPPPTGRDRAEHRRRFEEWLRAVGWRS